MAKTKVVIFEVNNIKYGIDILSVQEIIKMFKITPIPGTSEVVKGVISLRDQVIPLVNLSLYLGLPENDYTEETRTIIAEIRGKKYGLIVDNVCEVEDFSDKEMQDADLKIGNGKGIIKGIVKKEEQLWLILDIDMFNFN